MEYVTFWCSLPHGAGLVTLEIYHEGESLICGIRQIEGRLNLPPKAWLKAIRTELRKIEGIAKAAGCVEVRVAGRNWARVLDDYEPLPDDGINNRLRKVL